MSQQFNATSDSALVKFVKFQTMVMEYYIPFIFVIGLIFCGLFGLGALIVGLIVMARFGFLMGFLAITIGVIYTLLAAFGWRLTCETAIVLFKLHGNLRAIREKLESA